MIIIVLMIVKKLYTYWFDNHFKSISILIIWSYNFVVKPGATVIKGLKNVNKSNQETEGFI